jgi:hypothetical protein
MRKLTLLLLALTPFIAGNAFAGEPRGIQTYEIPELFDVYIPCLGEVVRVNSSTEGRGHVFETQKGTVHVIDNWFIHQMITGLSSGREWLGEGVSPFQMNIKVDGSGVNQWVSRIRWVPMDKGDPTVTYQNQFKVTVNAAGELVLVRPETPIEEAFRCLPKNSN